MFSLPAKLYIYRPNLINDPDPVELSGPHPLAGPLGAGGTLEDAGSTSAAWWWIVGGRPCPWLLVLLPPTAAASSVASLLLPGCICACRQRAVPSGLARRTRSYCLSVVRIPTHSIGTIRRGGGGGDLWGLGGGGGGRREEGVRRVCGCMVVALSAPIPSQGRGWRWAGENWGKESDSCQRYLGLASIQTAPTPWPWLYQEASQGATCILGVNSLWSGLMLYMVNYNNTMRSN